MCPDLSLAQLLGPSQFSIGALCLQAMGFPLVFGDCVPVLLQRQAEV